MTVRGFHLTPSRMTAMDVPASTLDGLTASLSDGFYTTFSTLSNGTRVLGLSAHLKRLYEPAENIGLHPSVDSDRLRHYIADLARQNLSNESRLRLILTKDTGDVYIGVQPFVPIPEAVYRDGVHVITREMARHDPRIKGTDFIAQSAEKELPELEASAEYSLQRRANIIVYNQFADMQQTNIGLESDLLQTGATTQLVNNKMVVYFEADHE